MTKIHNPKLDCVCLCVNRTIYEKLASAFTEEMAALYRQRVDEISPNIRYCAYNIGESHNEGQCQPCALKNNCQARQKKKVTRSKLTRHNTKYIFRPSFPSQVTRTPSMT